MSIVCQDFEAFLQAWTEDQLALQPYAKKIYTQLQGSGEVAFDYKARPGVSYSLRGAHTKQVAGGTAGIRPLFVLVDIIDDEPESRWLSVCFYADMINDPEELGNFVPAGLLGEDAMCFDLYEADADALEYVLARLDEAFSKAGE